MASPRHFCSQTINNDGLRLQFGLCGSAQQRFYCQVLTLSRDIRVIFSPPMACFYSEKTRPTGKGCGRDEQNPTGLTLPTRFATPHKFLAHHTRTALQKYRVGVVGRPIPLAPFPAGRGNTRSAGFRARPRSKTGTLESSPPLGAGLGVGDKPIQRLVIET